MLYLLEKLFPILNPLLYHQLHHLILNLLFLQSLDAVYLLLLIEKLIQLHLLLDLADIDRVLRYPPIGRHLVLRFTGYLRLQLLLPSHSFAVIRRPRPQELFFLGQLLLRNEIQSGLLLYLLESLVSLDNRSLVNKIPLFNKRCPLF